MQVHPKGRTARVCSPARREEEEQDELDHGGWKRHSACTAPGRACCSAQRLLLCTLQRMSTVSMP